MSKKLSKESCPHHKLEYNSSFELGWAYLRLGCDDCGKELDFVSVNETGVQEQILAMWDALKKTQEMQK